MLSSITLDERIFQQHHDTSLDSQISGILQYTSIFALSAFGVVFPFARSLLTSPQLCACYRVVDRCNADGQQRTIWLLTMCASSLCCAWQCGHAVVITKYRRSARTALKYSNLDKIRHLTYLRIVSVSHAASQTLGNTGCSDLSHGMQRVLLPSAVLPPNRDTAGGSRCGSLLS